MSGPEKTLAELGDMIDAEDQIASDDNSPTERFERKCTTCDATIPCGAQCVGCILAEVHS